MKGVLPADLIAQLQKDYLATFPEKVSLLQKSLKKSNWEGLYQVFHKLAGSGATYMMPEISRLGRLGEVYFHYNPHVEESVAEDFVSLMISVLEARLNGQAVDLDSNPLIQKLESKTA